MSKLELVANNEPEDIERHKLSDMPIKVQCDKCKRRWMIKIGDLENQFKISCECGKRVKR